MVATSILTKARKIAALVVAATGLVAATPTLANSAAANADITAPLRAAQDSRPSAAGGDPEFQQLFTGWKSGDSAGLVQTGTAASTSVAPNYRPSGVSIPSRMPLDGATLTSGYGMRFHPVIGGRRQHKGIDLAMPIGTPVYATADGVISQANWFSSYGLYISIEHGGNIQTRYGHLSRLNVAAGQTVRKGDLIGYVGSTGRSTGPHLHYEVRIAGNAVNPVPYLQGGAKPQTGSAAQLAIGGPDGDD